MDYQFSYDGNRTLMTIVQNGYWSMETFHAFEAEFLARHQEIFARHKNYRVLADCADFNVQSNEVGSGFAGLFERVMAEYRGRYAIIVGSTMNKLQARRVIPHANVEIFTKEEREQAIAWLLDDEGLILDSEAGT
jgi:hypothetical protein